MLQSALATRAGSDRRRCRPWRVADTVRRRVRCGELPAQHERGRLMVELPPPPRRPFPDRRTARPSTCPELRERASLLERQRETLTAELAAGTAPADREASPTGLVSSDAPEPELP